MQPSRNNPSSKPRVTLEEIRSLVQRSIDVAETLDKGTSEVKPPLRAVESLPSREGQRTAPALRAEIPPDNKLSKQISELIRQTSPVGPQRPRIEDQTRGGIAGSQQNRPDFPYAPKGSDVIPAMLTKDEFVVRAGPAQENRALLEAINNSIGNISNPTPYHSGGGPIYRAAGGTARDVDILTDVIGGAIILPADPEKAVGMFADALDKTFKGAVDALYKFPDALKQTVHDVMTPNTLGQQVNVPANFLKNTGEWLSNVPLAGWMGDTLQIVGEFAAVIGDSIDGLRKWNKELHGTNIQFKQFSGGMASVAAQQMVRDIYLSQERGERLAGTAGFQAEQKHRAEVEFAKYEDFFTSIQNVLSGTISGIVAGVLENMPLTGALLSATEALNALFGGGKNPLNEEFLNIGSRGRGKMLREKGKPNRFP